MKIENKRLCNLIILSLLLSVVVLPISALSNQESMEIQPYKLVLLNFEPQSNVTLSFVNILRSQANFHYMEMEPEKIDKLRTIIPDHSIIAIVGHGTETGLVLASEIIPWSRMGAFLTELNPYKVLVSSCFSSYLEEYYPEDIHTFWYNPDAEIAAWFTLFHLSTYYYEKSDLSVLKDINSDYFYTSLETRENYFIEQADLRAQELMSGTSNFKMLGTLDDILANLKDKLATDSDGGDPDYWVYDNTDFRGYDSSGTKVDFGEPTNEGNNAINIIWYGFNISEVYRLFIEIDWDSLVDGWGDKNYLNTEDGALEQDGNRGALMVLDYYRHCRYGS